MLTSEEIVKESERRERVLQEYLFSEEYQSKLKERLKIQDAGMRSPEARKNIFYLCQRPDDPAEGCIFFIENFGWTFNPKLSMKHFPFILFECQKRAIRDVIQHIDSGRDLFMEKSREMGVSWIVFCYISLWYWLCREGSNMLLGSYKEKLVDDRSIDSLFGKIDYALQNLPDWMIPNSFVMKKHRTKLKLANPENGNVITGDTMNPNFGRGSRKTFIAFDELAFWDYAKDAWESAGDATNCRIANSTPNGYDYYAMLRESGIDIVTLHWREHPLKDMQWYAYECKRRTEEEIAQELDISYTKSKVGRVYQEWNDTNVLLGKYEYDDNKPLYVGWDFGRSDETAIIWAQPSKEGLIIIDTYRNTGKNIDYYIPFVNGMIYGENNYEYKPEDMDIVHTHKNWKKATHFGDPAGRFRNQVTDDTVLSVLRRYGINVNFQDKWKEFKIRKHESKMLIMNRVFINDNPRTRYFNLCMIQASYPIVKVSGVGEVRSEAPKHDSTCLAGDTEIRTLDGWKKIKDLEGLSNFYVYGYSLLEKRIIPTLASKCWKTSELAELLEIGMDNGVSIKATPNHRFMMRDGSYKEASNISVGDSLMPFYERNESGYIAIDLNDGSRADEHRYVYNRLVGQIPLDYHIDHINGIKTDNHIENLEALSPSEHCSKTFRGKKMNDRKVMTENNKPYITKYSKSEIFRDCLFCGKEFKADHKTFYCNKKCTSAAYRYRNSGLVNREKNKTLYKNHKVRFIKRINPQAVYDIETPELHNFIANGVVVHNSHYRSSFEYLAIGISQMNEKIATPFDKFKKKDRTVRLWGRRATGY